MLKNKSSNSGSQGASSSQALSKSELKLIKNWAHNIANAMNNPGNCLERVTTLLGQYKGSTPDKTALLRAAMINIELKDLGEMSLIKIVIGYILKTDTRTTIEKKIHDDYVSILRLFMNNGAKPSLGTEIPSVMELYSQIESYGTPRAHQFRHKDIIEIMSKDPNIFDVVNDLGYSLLICAGHNGDSESIDFILGKRPDLLDKRNDKGTTLLLSMIINAQEEHTVNFINKYNPNMDLLYAPGLTALQCAIQKGKTKVAKTLLMKGCDVSHKMTGFIPESKIMLDLLGKSGYFLSSVNLFKKEEPNPYFLIASDKGTERISTVTELEQCKLSPCEKEIHRLHLSFQQIIQVNPHDNHTKALYDAFCKRFPSKNDMVIKAAVQDSSDHNFLNNKYLFKQVFTSIVTDIIKHAHNEKMISCILHNMRHYLSKELTIEFDSQTMLDVSLELNDKVGIKVDDSLTEITRTLIFLVCYEYSLKIFRVLIERKEPEIITPLINQSLFLMMGSMRIVGHDLKPSDDFIDLLKMMIDIGHQFKCPRPSIHLLQIMDIFTRVHLNLHYGFHTEILEVLTQFKQHTDYIKSNTRHPYGVAPVLFTITLLEKSLSSIYDTAIRMKIIIVCLSIIDIREVATDPLFGIAITSLRSSFIDTLSSLQKDYLNRMKSSLKGEDELRTYVIDEKNKRLSITFKQDCDAKKLQIFIKNLTVATLQSKAIVINLFEHDIDEVIESITQIQSLTLSDIQHDARPQPEPQDTQVTATNVTPQVPYYLPEPAKASSKPLPSAKPMPSVNQPAASASASSAPAMPAEDVIEPIKTEIRAKLGIAQGIMLYSLYNKPDIQDNRRHLFWGIWFATLIEENATFITADERNRFQTLLAEGGTFASSALNKHGLRPVMVQDTVTQKQVTSYKLKLASKGSRIFAAPIQVKLKTGEIAQVYCFAFPVTHKVQEQNTIPVDPRKLGLSG